MFCAVLNYNTVYSTYCHVVKEMMDAQVLFLLSELNLWRCWNVLQLVDLKAELLRKQEEFRQQKLQNATNRSFAVPKVSLFQKRKFAIAVVLILCNSCVHMLLLLPGTCLVNSHSFCCSIVSVFCILSVLCILWHNFSTSYIDCLLLTIHHVLNIF